MWNFGIGPKILQLVLSAPLFIAISSNANASIITGPIVNPANGHSYFLLNENNWTNSEAEALTLGGHMATINDAAENDWVFDTFSFFGDIDRDLWIGFSDAITEGVFLWSSGEPVTYTNWRIGEPNNGFGQFEEDYAFIVRLNGPSTWNDAPDVENAGIYGVVEVPNVVPEPGSASICLTTSCLLLHFMRKRWRAKYSTYRD